MSELIEVEDGNNDANFEELEDYIEVLEMNSDEPEVMEINESEPEVIEMKQCESELGEMKESQPDIEEMKDEPEVVHEIKLMVFQSPEKLNLVTLNAKPENTLQEIITTTNSQSSTKVNYLNLSDKENEEDAPVEEDTNLLVRATSIESITSSRSSSPIPGEDDDMTSNTIQLDNSSILSEESSKRKSSKSRESNILTIYPPPPEKGGISININDYQCLENNEFLNDVIIDFYLSYLSREVLSPEDKQRTHIFSSHFYTRFAKPYQNVDDSTFANEDERRHAGVQRWTKNVDIFEKDFIIVPVNEHSHWYLVIICFPSLVTNDDNEPIIEYENPSTMEIQRPCILIFDSLYNNKSTVIKKLRGYLACEYLAKKGEQKSFSTSQLNFIRPKIPKQSNATDCGLFLLQYVENFFEVPIKDFSVPFRNLSNWFTNEVICGKREKIANLIQKFSTDFHEGKNVVFPQLVFSKKKRAINKSDTEDEEMTSGKRKNKTKKISAIVDSDSSSDEVTVPIRIEIKNQPLVEQNKSSWRNVKSMFSNVQNGKWYRKNVPCYTKSSEFPINDKPPLSSKDESSCQPGSPPYCLPSKVLEAKKARRFYSNNSAVNLEVLEGPAKRILMTPVHLESRGQKMVRLSTWNEDNKATTSKFFTGNPLPSFQISNKTDNFYSIRIDNN